MFYMTKVSLVQICERSLTGKGNGPTMPPVQSFVRAEMLSIGYLIRPCEGGECIIHIVDHVESEVAFLTFLLFPITNELWRKSSKSSMEW